jgi:hypothetical protein
MGSRPDRRVRLHPIPAFPMRRNPHAAALGRTALRGGGALRSAGRTAPFGRTAPGSASASPPLALAVGHRGAVAFGYELPPAAARNPTAPGVPGRLSNWRTVSGATEGSTLRLLGVPGADVQRLAVTPCSVPTDRRAPPFQRRNNSLCCPLAVYGIRSRVRNKVTPAVRADPGYEAVLADVVGLVAAARGAGATGSRLSSGRPSGPRRETQRPESLRPAPRT